MYMLRMLKIVEPFSRGDAYYKWNGSLLKYNATLEYKNFVVLLQIPVMTYMFIWIKKIGSRNC